MFVLFVDFLSSINQLLVLFSW